ncbi:MAG: hypothetical protein AB1938_03095 [Myxococcota bacterium]
MPSVKGASPAWPRRVADRIPPKDDLTMQRMFASALHGIPHTVKRIAEGRYEIATPQPQKLIDKLTQGGSPNVKLKPGESRIYAFSGSDVRVVAQKAETFAEKGQQGWVGKQPSRGGNGPGWTTPEGFSGGRN